MEQGRSMHARQGSLAAFFILTFSITWGIAAFLLLFPNQAATWFGPMSTRNPLFILAVCAPTLSAIVLASSMEGWSGLKALLSRLVRWRFGIQWYLFVLL